MRIDAVRPFFWNVPSKATIILGMCRGRQGEGLFRRVSNEKLLPGNAKALPSISSVNLGSMCLEPSPIPLEALVLLSSLCQLLCVGQLFHNQGNLLGSYHGMLLRGVMSL